MIYHLFRWSVTNSSGGTSSNPYLAPERQRIYLVGYRDQEKKRVRTSPIEEVNGKEVKTASGSIYILEDMDPDYRQWLEDKGYEYDPDNPIKVK